MAVIVLPDADFSANNIGSITLKRAFLPGTKRMLSLYGLTIDEDDTLQRAFDDFVRDLTSAGLLGDSGKIKALCLPFLADSLAEAQINAIDGSNFFAANLGAGVTLTSKGLKPVEGGAVEKINHTKFTGLTTSYHYAGFNITAEVSDNSGDRNIIGRNGHIMAFQKYDNARPTILLNTGSVNRVLGDTNYKFAACLMIANLTPSKATLFCNGQKTYLDSPSYIGASVSYDPIFGDYYSITNYSANCSKASWSLLSIGEALSDAESTAYNNAVNALMAVVAAL